MFDTETVKSVEPPSLARNCACKSDARSAKVALAGFGVRFIVVPSIVTKKLLKSSIAGVVPKLTPEIDAVFVLSVTAVPTDMPPLLVCAIVMLNGLPPFSELVLLANPVLILLCAAETELI